MAKNVIQIVIDATDNASSIIGGFADALKATGILAFAKKVTKTSLELAQLGQQSQAAEARLVAFSGSAQAAEATLSAIDAATGGTISRMDAAAAATRLFQMGLASTAEEAANVVSIATMLGDQTQSAGDRVADFSALLSNQSIPRLDNFGISSARVRTRIEELQAAMPGLSRETAFMQAVMEQASISVEKLGTSSGASLAGTARLTAEIDNLKAATGEQLAPALNDVSGRLADSIGAFASYQKAVNDATKGMTYYERQAYVSAAADRAFGDGMTHTADAGLALHGTLFKSGEIFKQQVDIVNSAMQAYRDAQNEQALFATMTYDTSEAMAQYNAAISGQEQAAVAAATAQRELASSTAEAARVASEARIAFVDAASGIQEMSQASFARAQLETLKQAQEDGKISLEQYSAAQQAVLLEFGVLTQAELAAQTKLENLTAAFTAGRLSPEEYAAALEGVKEKVDVSAESANVLAAAQANVAATTSAATVSSGAEAEALGLLTGQSAATTAMLDTYAVANDNVAAASERVAGVAGAQSGALGSIASASDVASGALERVQERIDALKDKTVTVTVQQRVEAAAGLGAAGLSPEEAASIMGGAALPGMASGFSGVFATPTARLFGESGPERVTATPLHKTMNETYNVTYNAAPSFGRVSQDIAFARARAGR